ncbi:hypothetical protein [Ramlibacter sp. WS9]|uniref:DMP19 family protein n=1 Tax=Ramlibacter sp. WS9 TaxID=1882741 RepID=UPI001142C661|nr:hypothetical protein [Ramlibacter sp. WS9]ROZ61474.1 hypothetical protein EEB15_32625 [Ramlibacter sp. WS9]
MTLDPSVLPSLERLRTYMYRHYPAREKVDPFPLAFWKIEDDDIFFEALGYLPLMMEEVHDEGLDHLPEGFRLAYPVFWLEDDYQFNGWTALTNAGEDLLLLAIGAYERIGLATEANALRAALASVIADPSNDEAAGDAYQSVENPYADEDTRWEALLRFFRANTRLFEGAT